MADVYGPRGLFLISLFAFSLGFLELYHLLTGQSSGFIGWSIAILMFISGVYYVWRAYNAKKQNPIR